MHIVTLAFLLSITILTLNAYTETIIKPSGYLYFFDSEYTLNFEIDLKPYFKNALLLQNNTHILEQKCTNNSDLIDCTFFKQNFKQISDMAIKETYYIRQGRKKRAILCMLIATLTITIATSIAGYFAGAAIASAHVSSLKEQHNIQHNTTLNQFTLNENQIDIENRSINTLFNNINQLEKNFTEAQFINQLLASTLISIDKHNRDTEKYVNALSDQLYIKFFSIIDILTFKDALQHIKTKLPDNSPILSLSPHKIIKICSLYSELINETIHITIYIPIVVNEKYSLFNLIPIPVMRDNTTFILNSDAKYLLKNKSFTWEISMVTLTKCIKIADLNICNSLLFEQLIPINNCTEAIINKIDTKGLCTYKILPEKNQLIRISDESIYIYIIKPILLKISCGQDINTMNITKSMEIPHEKRCKLTKPMNDFSFNSTTSTVKIESIYVKPNFTIFDNNHWSRNIEFLNKYNIEIQNLYRDFKQIQFKFEQRSKLLENSDSDFFSMLMNFSITEIMKYIILFVIFPITLILLISCCICQYRK